MCVLHMLGLCLQNKHDSRPPGCRNRLVQIYVFTALLISLGPNPYSLTFNPSRYKLTVKQQVILSDYTLVNSMVYYLQKVVFPNFSTFVALYR